MAAVSADLLEEGFPRILWECLQLCDFDRKPVYTICEHDMGETMTEYQAKIMVLARPTGHRRPYRFTGPRMPSEAMAVQLVAREAICLLRDTIPEMQQRASQYLPFKEGPQTESQIVDPIEEEDSALTHLAYFTIAEDRVVDQLIEELVEARRDLRQAQDQLRIQEEQHASEGRPVRASRGGVHAIRDIYVEGEQPEIAPRITGRQYRHLFQIAAPSHEDQPPAQRRRIDPAPSSSAVPDHESAEDS